MKGQPLRLRPASNPEKKMMEPDTEFTSYDYSKADYSEFKPPQAPHQKKHKDKVRQLLFILIYRLDNSSLY